MFFGSGSGSVSCAAISVESQFETVFFGQYADSYDAYSSVQASVFDQLITYFPTSARHVLDVGCGTGRSTFQLVNQSPGIEITAFDFAGDMIDVALTKHSHPNIAYRVSDADGFQTDDRFDVIISNATFQWLPSPGDTLMHLGQFLRRDGCFLFSAFGPQTFFELSELLSDIIGVSIELPAKRFLTPQNWTTLLKSLFDSADVTKALITARYPSVIHLLLTTKITDNSSS